MELIADTLEYGNPHPHHGTKMKNHRVRLAAPLQLPAASVPIDPYVLGYWLGDGDTDMTRITVGEQDMPAFVGAMTTCGELPRQTAFPSNVGKAARFVFCEPRHKGNATARESTFQGRLRALGVLGRKHIPTTYLRASEAQRWMLLRGLMDSDGSAGPSGQCEFASNLPQLADDVRELLASLGLRPGPLQRLDATLYGRVVGDRYRVCFQAYADQPVFGLERKQGRIRPRATTGHGYRKRCCEAIFLGEVVRDDLLGAEGFELSLCLTLTMTRRRATGVWRS